MASPTVVLNLRAGLARYEQFSGSNFAGGYDPRTLGFPDSLVSQFLTLQFPRFNLGAYSELGASTVTNFSANDTWSLQPNATWMKGRQILKFGGEFRLYNRNTLAPGLASGSYTFNKQWTQANPLQADALSGNEFASFLLGLPGSGSVDRNINSAYQNRYYTLFAQDDIKVSRTLTINVGLRWDYETPLQERYNRLVRGFGFDQNSPLSVPGYSLKGGLLYAGSGGDQRYSFNPFRTAFQPRIGFAWKAASNFVIRGGYGLTYLGQSSTGQTTGFSRPTPLIASTDGNITPAVSLTDPFPRALYPGGLLQPIGSTQGLATNLGQSVTAQFLDRPLPRSHQFSFGLQRQIPWGFLADAAYVGNLTHKLPVTLPLNFIPADVLNSMPVANRPAFFNAQVDNPFAGLLPSSGINGAKVARSQLLVAYPQFTGVSITDVPIGGQSYHSAQMKLTRRFTQGIGVTAAYTISKTLERVSLLNAQDVTRANLLNTPLEQRLYQFDTPRKLSLVVTTALPFGRGKAFGAHWSRAVDGVLGGWNMNAQYNNQTGFPFDFPNAAPLTTGTAALSDAQRDKLAVNRGGTQFDPSLDAWFNTDLFPNKAQTPFTQRNFPTRFPDVRSKPLHAVEFSVYKEIPIRERVRWQIRADFHNALNHPWFNHLASNDVANSQFGRLAAESIDDTSEPRLIVIAMKIVF